MGYRWMVWMWAAWACVAATPERSLRIPPIKTTVQVNHQPVTVTASGVLRDAGKRGDEQVFRLEMSADLGDLQAHITELLHYERYGCAKAFGKQMVKRLVGGNGSVRVKLTPVVEEKRRVRLKPEVGEMQADGSLGELLRSGSLGAALPKGPDLNATLKAVVERAATIEAARFVDSGGGL